MHTVYISRFINSFVHSGNTVHETRTLCRVHANPSHGTMHNKYTSNQISHLYSSHTVTSLWICSMDEWVETFEAYQDFISNFWALLNSNVVVIVHVQNHEGFTHFMLSCVLSWFTLSPIQQPLYCLSAYLSGSRASLMTARRNLIGQVTERQCMRVCQRRLVCFAWNFV